MPFPREKTFKGSNLVMEPSRPAGVYRESRRPLYVNSLNESALGEAPRSTIWSCAFQQFDRPSLRPFLTLTDLHPHTLTFRQPAQPAALKRRRVDENILPTTVLPYEAKPLFAVVPFDRTDGFLGRPDAGLSLRGRAWLDAPLRRVRRRSGTCVHLDQFAGPSALGRFGPLRERPQGCRYALLPPDDCYDGLRCLRRARPWIARPPFGYSILGGVIVIEAAALRLTVVFVAAHSTSIGIRNNHQVSRSLRKPSQEGRPRKFAIRQEIRKPRRSHAIDNTQPGHRRDGTSTRPCSSQRPGRSAGGSCWRTAPTAPIAEIVAAEKKHR